MRWTVCGALVGLSSCTEAPQNSQSDSAEESEPAIVIEPDSGDSSTDSGIDEPDEPDEYPGVTVHVAVWGDDSHDGSELQPLASLEAARDSLRALKESGGAELGASVVIHGGTYVLSRTVELDARDSASSEAPIIYRAASGEGVRISGGHELDTSAFIPVTDSEVLSRLVDSDAASQLLMVDLSGAGLDDYGELSRRGWNLGWSSVLADPQMELIIDDQIMPLARWPNDGTVTLSGVVDPGPVLGDEEFWTRGGTFSHEWDRSQYWSEAEDIWLDGTLGKDWEWTHNRVETLDVESKQITVAHGEVSGILNWEPFFVFRNLLEEIDEPGEYFIDRDAGVLYVLPPEGFDLTSRAVVSVLQDDLIRLDGADHVVFRDLIFEDGRENGIYGEDTDGLIVEGCILRNLGMDAVQMIGTANALRQSEIRGVGRRGVFAGPLPWGWPEDGIYSAADHQNLIADSVFEDFGRLYQAYYPAVDVDGVGVRVRGNQIGNGPHMGVQIRGNDHFIEYNEISEIGLVFKDIGAVYANLGKLPGERGTLVRRNFIHHLGGDKDKLFGVYLDNGTMGVTVEENIFYAIGSAEYPDSAAVMSNHGQHIVVRNNLMIDTAKPFRLSLYLNCDGTSPGWGCADQSSFESVWQAYFDSVPSDHSLAYPELSSWAEEDHWEPTTNRYYHNVIFNLEIPLVGGAHQIDYASPAFTLNESGNWVTSSDPGLVDLESMDFNQIPGGAMFGQIPNLRPIPFDDIGPGQLGTTLDIPVRADATASARQPRQSFGSEAEIVVQQERGQALDQVGYLQVSLQELSDPVERAELYIYARVTWASESYMTLHAVYDDEWDDATRAPTWEDHPSIGPALGTAPVIGDKYAWVGIDVTEFVQSEQSEDGVASFALQLEEDGWATVFERAREQGPVDGVPRTAFLRVTLP